MNTNEFFSKSVFTSNDEVVAYVKGKSLVDKKAVQTIGSLPDYKSETLAGWAIENGYVTVQPVAQIDESESLFPESESDSPVNHDESNDETHDESSNESEETPSTSATSEDEKAAKEIVASVNRTRSKLQTVYNEVSAMIQTMVTGGILNDSNKDTTMLMLLSTKTVDNIAPSCATAEAELMKRINSGVIKANEKVVTIESLEAAKTKAVSPADKFDSAIEQFFVDNKDMFTQLNEFVAEINTEIAELCKIHNAEMKFSISPINGEVEIVNTLRKGIRRVTDGVRNSTKSETGKKIVIRGLNLKGHVNGIEYKLTSDNTSWKLLANDTEFASGKIDSEVTPTSELSKHITLNSDGKTKRSIYTVFGEQPVYYDTRPSKYVGKVPAYTEIE